jgi:hypothetical protein
MKQPGVLVVLITFILAISFVVASQEAKNDGFVTTLTGANEVNGVGDTDGSGVFKFSVKNLEQQLCYELSASNIAAATTATINLGDAVSNGSVVIVLDAPTNGRSQGCVASKAEILADITANPSRYYVNVMNAEFPNGAIRGQLK